MRKRIFSYAFFISLINFLLLGIFALQSDDGKLPLRSLFLLTSNIMYTVVYFLPALLPLLIAWLAKSEGTRKTLFYTAAALNVISELILIGDIFLLHHFGFHINGLVINLLTTPGGFDSMGLDSATILPVALGIILLFALQMLFAWAFLKGKCVGPFVAFISRQAVVIASGIVFLFSLLFALFSTGVADFYANKDILTNMEIYPFVLKVRMRSFMKAIGCQEPSRIEAPTLMEDIARKGKIHYPSAKIVQNHTLPKYNIIWIVAESLRTDLLTPEIMPNLWNYSENALRFTRQYSGGNGTRAAMFSMFYGLYGLNWDNFINNRRPPLLFDWLEEDKYAFLCQTSTDFTYPEFDKTIFSSLPNDCLVEIEKNAPSHIRDSVLIDNMIEFMASHREQPFFTFGFLESTHAPYNFPEDKVLRKDYMRKINYTTVSAKDAQALYNRYANAAHHIDTLLGRIFAWLESNPSIGENTIFIFTGDHGEEFYEKGRLGHNSTFVEEQIRPAMVMKLPGVKPQVIDFMTHHTDIIPTVAKFLGIENPPGDFSVGQNILGNYNRDHYLVTGWESGIYIDQNYKCQLPVGAKGGFFPKKITHLDDTPCTEEENDSFFSRHSRQIMQIQQELHRFIDK